MKLQKLQPRLSTLNTSRVKVLDTKAGATERVSGRAWMKVRREVLAEGLYACCDCGRVSANNEIDHDTPLEQGGAAMDKANLKIRCVDCHKVKTNRETKARFGY